MGLKSKILKPIAKRIAKQIDRWSDDAVGAQQKVFDDLIKVGKKTAFGKDHNFNNIDNHEAFKAQIPIRDYEDLKPYMKENNILD